MAWAIDQGKLKLVKGKIRQMLGQINLRKTSTHKIIQMKTNHFPFLAMWVPSKCRPSPKCEFVHQQLQGYVSDLPSKSTTPQGMWFRFPATLRGDSCQNAVDSQSETFGMFHYVVKRAK